MDQNLQDMEIGNTKEDVMTSDVDKQGYTQREWDRVVGYGKVPEYIKKSKEKECTNIIAQLDVLWMVTLLMSILIWVLILGYIMSE